MVELDREVARYARLRQLAQQNGDRGELVDVPGQPGRWWQVPEHLQPLVGVQLARVA